MPFLVNNLLIAKNWLRCDGNYLMCGNTEILTHVKTVTYF